MILKKQSIAKNYVMQMIYQILILVIPFVISPYLTRTLKESALGTYSYVNSIAYYFIIAANLGIGVHGRRVISRCSNDIELRKTFWSLYLVHSFFAIMALLIYFVFVFFAINDNKTIFIIDSIYVLSALFDITWLFYGIENFSSVVIKNSIVKFCECIAIFLFVKSPKDITVYVLISALGSCIGQLAVIPKAIRIVKPVKFNLSDCKQHIRPLFVYSVAQIASSMYTVFDKTLLGIMSNKSDVAFYEYSYKIVNIPKILIGVIGTVMLPRACKLVSEGKVKEQKKYMNMSALFTAFLGMGSIFGLCAIAPLFARVYYGESFAVCGNIIIALSPTIYIVGAGSVLRCQYLIPNGFDKQFNLSIVYNAVINLCISMLLIPRFGVYGAVIGTLSAEIFGLLYQTFLSRKFIDLKEICYTLIPFVIIGMIMFIIIKFAALYLNNDIGGLIIEVFIGIGIYCSLSILYICFFRKDVLIMIKGMRD